MSTRISFCPDLTWRKLASCHNPLLGYSHGGLRNGVAKNFGSTMMDRSLADMETVPLVQELRPLPSSRSMDNGILQEPLAIP